jgi:glycosyltransferase involved in cell wall biosynthesis
MTPTPAMQSDDNRSRGALFVMPSPSAGQSGPVAVWITAAGWASAARRQFGTAWVLTPHGVFSPEEAAALATRPALAPPAGRRGWRRYVPVTLRTAAKDVLQIRKARRYRKAAMDGPWNGHDLAFVWQRHDLFHTAGFELARARGVPLVLFVDAPLVWEARKWGVRRPGWGKLLELAGERWQLRSADLVACVSDEVADELKTRGVSPDRLVVTPCSVDLETFTPETSGESVRQRFGLEGKFVVGWLGSFRRFHGVDLTLQAAALIQDRVPDLALLLVGDGLERPRMERLAHDLGLRNAVFTGTVPHSDVAGHIAAMDVSLVLDRGEQGFHYSPLKLREYMACGKAVIGPSVGELNRVLTDGVDGLLVRPGDPETLAAAIENLHGNPSRRRLLGSAARAKVAQEWSWDRQLERVFEALTNLAPAGMEPALSLKRTPALQSKDLDGADA